MILKNKRVLVTGGMGFIGTHVVDALISRGAEVITQDTVYGADRQRSVVGEERVGRLDVIIHMAALGVAESIVNPKGVHEVNATGTLDLLRAGLRAGVTRFVHVSSSEVYGTARYVPMDEKHPCRPHTVYAASKLAGEAYARAFHKTYGMEVTILRPFNSFGPGSHREMIPRSMELVLENRPIQLSGDGSQTRDLTYVTDTAEGIVRGAEVDELISKTMNFGSGKEITMKELAYLINEIMGRDKLEVMYTPPRQGDVMRLCADSGRFHYYTGWEVKVGLREGLERMIQCFG